MRKVLFICSANLDRSPTAERLFHDWKGRWEAKSTGIMPSLGRNPTTQTMIDWADLILVMEPIHAQYVLSHFKCDSAKLHILDIENKYTKNDPELILELERKVQPILNIEDGLRETWEKSHS